MAFLQQRLLKKPMSNDPMYVIDLGVLHRLFEDWCKAFPRVNPFYAVKCNPNPAMIAMLAALGAGFDCASEAEMELVLNVGVTPEHIIYAHPCKPPNQLESAARQGINVTTFDTPAELHKIKRWHPQTATLLRIRADDPSARCCLGNKYGCEMADTGPLLLLASSLGIRVSGVSFHVGSGAMSPEAFSAAIYKARQVFDLGATMGFAMSTLDIGGGFGGSLGPDGHANLCGMPAAINAALDRWFPAESNVTILAEPGRFFAEAPSTLACAVYGRRDRWTLEGQQQVDYWISDGIYGSLNGIIYDHTVPQPLPMHIVEPSRMERKAFPTTLFGPTCDGADVIVKDYLLPELDMGDWIIFKNMGAYSIAGACDFNGFRVSKPTIHYLYSERP